MSAFHEAAKVLRGVVDGSVSWFLLTDLTTYLNNTQIPFDTTTLDAAKSSIVYGVTKNVSTAGRAVSMFIILLLDPS